MMLPQAFGPCCNCRQPDTGQIVLFLDQRGPDPGQGWGCFQCGLPPDGATCLVCLPCFEKFRAGGITPLDVVKGPIRDGGRIAVKELAPERFWHDLARHPELRNGKEHRQ